MRRLFARRHRTLEELDEIRATRAAGISRVIWVSGIILLTLVAFVLSMLVLTPLLERSSLEQEREYAQSQLERAKKDEAEARNRFLWMSDPEYFEQQARDRANQAKDGEIVVRRPTVEEEAAMERAETAAERDRAVAEETAKTKSESKKSSSRKKRK